jgi:ribonuclease E
MSRQRIRPSLGESSQHNCPRCDGRGTIRSVESLALSVLRVIHEEALKKQTEKLIIRVSVDAATFLLNEKRSEIEQIEKRNELSIVILPNLDDTHQEFEVQRIKSADKSSDQRTSYDQIHQPERSVPDFVKSSRSTEEPAIKDFLPEHPAPAQRKETSNGLLKRFWRKIVGDQPEETSKTSTPKSAKKPSKASTQKDNESPTNKRSRNKNNPEKTVRKPRRSRRNSTEDDQPATPQADQQGNPVFTRRNKGRRNKSAVNTDVVASQAGSNSAINADVANNPTQSQDKPATGVRRRSNHSSRRRSVRRKPETANISDE